MKISVLIVFISIINLTTYSQEVDYNLDNGYIAEGYDVVSYFMKSPKKGKNDFTYIYINTKLKFTSQSNLNLFKKNPKKYFPQYGGWCAYAMGAKQQKVTINPKTYEIRNGKLYLFYNSWGTNTLSLWLEENPIELAKKADRNWKQIKLKK